MHVSALQPETRTELLALAKQQWVMGQLRQLRQSNPSPPMVSVLDLTPADLAGEDEEVRHTAAPAAPPIATAAPATATPLGPAAAATAQPTPCQCCLILKAEVNKLRQSNAILIARERKRPAQRRRFQRAPPPDDGPVLVSIFLYNFVSLLVQHWWNKLPSTTRAGASPSTSELFREHLPSKLALLLVLNLHLHSCTFLFLM